MQDNGPLERGFLLGFDQRSFTFSLAAQKDVAEEIRLTKVRAQTAIQLGRWYHIVGTYDGVNMRLYVNGKEEATSQAQSGPIA